MRVLPLTGDHDRPGFDCGSQALNDWLCQVARQHQDKGLSRTFVAVADDAPEHILGYYALTLAELENRHLPDAWRKKLPRRIPGVRLGRLAVERAAQGRGLGALLLVDALTRARHIHAQAGGIGLFVDALDDRAAGFYQRFGFAATPDEPLMLFLPVGALGGWETASCGAEP
ncbi:MAG: GNAT family N-acetyltransferase [Rhodocyclaceae bacterium]|nr:GNAT family N-acetyltransferase [Rhodocyclaceae bacterium]